ncbi:DUF3892 domain-containing protein [Sorangium sp. So ce693]|uniref:DUF3892 domain-containing protein n=1 Tax=Sorangium sp. So ce693 TaxID=3133318 RepID=UPI003F61F943
MTGHRQERVRRASSGGVPRRCNTSTSTRNLMAARRFVATGKSRDGEITKLFNAGELWLPRSKADVIADIENKVHMYYVLWPGDGRTAVRVENGSPGKYLRTDRDSTTRSNLLDLPDC